MKFCSPTKGMLSFNSMFQDMIDYVFTYPKDKYKLTIGTDSLPNNKEKICFVTAVIIHRVGKGARYYYCRQNEKQMTGLRQRIYYETYSSLEVAARLTAKLAENGKSDLNIEIHLDVGEKGDTKDMIKEVVGMVIGSGFAACIKPDSYAASTVADRHTR